MRNPLHLVLAALLVAVGLFACQAQESEPKAPATGAAARAPAFVPDTTVFFVGNLETFAIQPGLELFAKQSPALASEQLQKLMAAGAQLPATPGGKFLMGLNAEYMAAAAKPDQFSSSLGIADPLDFAFYAVGAVPVMRIAVSDPAAFFAFVDRAQTTAGVDGVAKTLGAASYRTYRLSPADAPANQAMDLVVGVDEGFAVLTLASGALDEGILALALGTPKPEKSLATSGRLEAMAKDHGLLPIMIGYLDHRLLAEGLADPEPTSLGSMLVKLDAGPGSELPAVIDLVRTPACRQEFAAMADLWPRTLFGYTEYQVEKPPYRIDSRLIFESKDEALLGELGKLVGEIPLVAKGDALLSMGLGLRVDALLPFAMATRTRLLQASYQCPPLQSVHEAAVAQNPAVALGMLTGLAAGVSGLSATVLDLKLAAGASQEQPRLEAIDLVATLSVQDPATFLAKVLAMAPAPYNALNLPADGTPVEIPLPPMPNAPVTTLKLAAKGDKIVAYVGAKAEQAVERLATSGEATKALLRVSMNYAKYFGLVGNMLERAAPGSGQAALFEGLEGFDADIDLTLEVNQRGILFDSDMGIRRP